MGCGGSPAGRYRGARPTLTACARFARSYPCEWGGVAAGRPYAAGLEEFGQLVLQDVWSVIQKLYLQVSRSALGGGAGGWGPWGLLAQRSWACKHCPCPHRMPSAGGPAGRASAHPGGRLGPGCVPAATDPAESRPATPAPGHHAAADAAPGGAEPGDRAVGPGQDGFPGARSWSPGGRAGGAASGSCAWNTDHVVSSLSTQASLVSALQAPDGAQEAPRVFFHFSGARPDQGLALTLLRRLCAYLRRQLCEPGALPTSYRCVSLPHPPAY